MHFDNINDLKDLNNNNFGHNRSVDSTQYYINITNTQNNYSTDVKPSDLFGYSDVNLEKNYQYISSIENGKSPKRNYNEFSTTSVKSKQRLTPLEIKLIQAKQINASKLKQEKLNSGNKKKQKEQEKEQQKLQKEQQKEQKEQQKQQKEQQKQQQKLQELPKVFKQPTPKFSFDNDFPRPSVMVMEKPLGRRSNHTIRDINRQSLMAIKEIEGKMSPAEKESLERKRSVNLDFRKVMKDRIRKVTDDFKAGLTRINPIKKGTSASLDIIKPIPTGVPKLIDKPVKINESFSSQARSLVGFPDLPEFYAASPVPNRENSYDWNNIIDPLLNYKKAKK